MVEQLNSFAFEVTRVAREVGTEGKLGGQAEVRGVAGTWKDLTDSVNMMASNLTNQVRGIAKVVTAVATGNLKQKLAIVSRGEVAQLIDTINEMIDTLALFADQVTTVAREVGVDGRLGGQASVPGASGIWKNLTENVNQLAQNLTTQVRSISEVASAVTKGDLDPNHSRGSERRSGSIERYDQPDDRQPEGNNIEKSGTGLAEIKPCQVYADAAGSKRSENGYTAYSLRTGTGRNCALWSFLYSDTG